MPARIAIHRSAGSFSDRWLLRANDVGCDVVTIDCLSSAVIGQLRDCDALLWNWVHTSPSEQLAARSVINAAERAGTYVFPSSDTCWHFDDKIAQKYALEAVGAPLAPTCVLYDREQALEWCRTATYPLVFKLRRGAGSANVRLIASSSAAASLICRAFGGGLPAVAGYTSDAAVRLSRARGAGDLLAALIRAPRTMGRIRRLRAALGRERGYALFQEFMPDNRQDTRITVIGNRAFGFTRGVRPNDFRASGSGRINNDPRQIDPRFVRVAFDVTASLNAQSLAIDFVLDKQGLPAILEISYTFVAQAVRDCPGYWDRSLAWHPGHVWPQDAILDDVLESVARRRALLQGNAAKDPHQPDSQRVS